MACGCMCKENPYNTKLNFLFAYIQILGLYFYLYMHVYLYFINAEFDSVFELYIQAQTSVLQYVIAST